MFALRNASFACGVRRLASSRLRRLAVRRKLEDACYRRRWRRSPPTAAAGAVDTPRRYANRTKLEPATSAAVILVETGQYYSCYSRYSCGNNCNVVVKLVQDGKFFLHFTSVLRKQFAANDTILREANCYKRALALRNARQGCVQ